MKDLILRFPMIIYLLTLVLLASAIHIAKNHIDSNINNIDSKYENTSLLRNAHINIYNPKGIITHHLNSPELWYLLASGDMHLKNIQLQYQPANPKNLNISAKQGRFDKTTNQIYLNNDVEIRRPKSTKQNQKTLTTSSAIIEMDKNIAHTNKEVILQDGKIYTKSLGMTADLKTNEIKLHSKVEIIHEN